MGYSLVWFKRDLRLHDHAALQAAAAQGPVLCLYVIEPSLWTQPDAARQHYEFILESLRELAHALITLGGRLQVRTGEVTDVLAQLHTLANFERLFSHEETGNAVTFERDKAVARWCRAQSVSWQEFPQFGVVRRLTSRNHWQSHWASHTQAPQLPCPQPENSAFKSFVSRTDAAGSAVARQGEATTTPMIWERNKLQFQPSPWPAQAVPSAQELGLAAFEPPDRQRGGRSAGLAVLESFLNDRCRHYRGGISSPLSAPSACSRLSPYLSFGALSLREVVQATDAKLLQLKERSAYAAKGLEAFLSRLHWHCHFIQKLESEPELAWRNLHRGYDGLREPDWNPAHFEALTQGRTGWPMVDACVAMLRETGWLNFRMRAMLVSVAAYPLWLHWQLVGQWLARQFLDYEPGIHWSQMQMQSGTTGINTTRVYNPVKQAQDHDPQGFFVRRWCPALRRVPDSWLLEPWRMPESVQAACGVRVSADAPAGAPDAWPLPPVDLERATRVAKDRLHSLRRRPEVRAAKAAIVEKHGSRKGRDGQTASTRRLAPASAAASAQLSLGFE
ncbi:cryptochrome/deoxyribodipyrimidine photo-lyase family protein [Rhodoferax antarcticus]|uniref:cryptochrome/deoxyribodipyrimidine photo-lyase family protein n=1 Tax=Rhodoferax antarcticus TaxID=81479 RepID=UPI0022242E20|nr:FAD-binding domain-containing protein [Rhodoferax antarcticus]MCW2310651.1 deoxyribodipyrimidine photo-lyase [Rhodoferax antarcticus]